MVKSSASALALSLVRYAGSIMDISMKVQGSGSGKALDIGELLASAYSASAPLDRFRYHTIARLEERL